MLDVAGLTDIERQLLEAATAGRLLDLRPNRAGKAPDGPTGAKVPIRGTVLVSLLTEDLPEGVAAPLAVRVRGAEITGNLNLGGRTLRYPLELRDCNIGGRVSLALAEAPSVSFRGSTLHKGLSARQVHITHMLNLSQAMMKAQVSLRGAHVGGQVSLFDALLLNAGGTALAAEGMEVIGSLFCSGRFVSHGEIRLLGAQISGQVNFSGAHLLNPDSRALAADRITITRGLSCAHGFAAQGEVRLAGVQISGQVDFSGAHLLNPGGNALSADHAKITGGLICHSGFVSHGEIHLRDSQISGQADFSGAHLVNPGRNVLLADGAKIIGGLRCQSGFVADGEIRLMDTQIDGQVTFSGAHLLNANSYALTADRATITGGLSCPGGFVAEGEVSILGAQISGQVNFSGAQLLNPGGDALSADHAKITGGLICHSGFVSHGEIRLPGAEIIGEADFAGAHLFNAKSCALFADGMSVTDGLRCDSGFIAEGQLSLPYAHIGRNLHLVDAVLHGDGHYALSLERATVGTELRLRCKSIGGGIVDVTGATVGHLDDDPARWPADSLFTGLTYRSICDRGDDFSAARRDWVHRHGGGYAPQVYDQLASTYRAAGHSGGARTVLIAKQSARRSQPLPNQTRFRRVLRPPRRAVRTGWSWTLRWTIGYGYAPWRSLWWLVPVYLGGWLGIFRRIGSGDLTALHHGEVFHPALYTLDLLVPVVSLKQRDAWAVHGGYEWWAAVYTAIGWLAATIIAAGLAGVFKRD